MNFFAEFQQLKSKTFRTSGYRGNSINSDYTYNTKDLKNCYLLANALQNEDCMYGRDFFYNQDCVDCDHILRCTLCYETINCKECWNCSYLLDCSNCQDCDYGYYLKDCKNCIGCVGLRKKEFYIFNKPYSEAEFLSKKKTLKPEEIRRKFEELQLKIPRVYSIQLNTENCVGDYIQNSKNVFYGFDAVECQDCGYIEECKKCFNSWDMTCVEEATDCYYISAGHVLNNCSFCYLCAWSSDLEYCEWIVNSRHCFGCVSLNHKEYYILNKPYSAEDYFKRVAEIKDRLKKEGTYGRTYLTPTYPFADTCASWPRM